MSIRMLITPHQAKTARKLLGFGSMTVARALQITRFTLTRAETSKVGGAMSDLLSARLRKFYEENGIDFQVGEDGSSARIMNVDISAIVGAK